MTPLRAAIIVGLLSAFVVACMITGAYELTVWLGSGGTRLW